MFGIVYFLAIHITISLHAHYADLGLTLKNVLIKKAYEMLAKYISRTVRYNILNKSV